MTVPLRKISICLDSCAIDPKDNDEKIAIDKIHLWRREGVILDITPSVQEEINHPHTPLEVKRVINELGYTLVKPDLNEEEKKCLDQIKNILAGNGDVRSIHKDADNVFEAHKNAANYFVTLDKKILKKREQLQKLCSSSLAIVKPSELVKKYDWEFVNMKALRQKRFYYGSR
jgi:predicted nucleic acid-binding protein